MVYNIHDASRDRCNVYCILSERWVVAVWPSPSHIDFCAYIWYRGRPSGSDGVAVVTPDACTAERHNHLPGSVSRLQDRRLLGPWLATAVFRPLRGSRDRRQTVSGEVAGRNCAGRSRMYADRAQVSWTSAV